MKTEHDFNGYIQSVVEDLKTTGQEPSVIMSDGSKHINAKLVAEVANTLTVASVMASMHSGSDASSAYAGAALYLFCTA